MFERHSVELFRTLKSNTYTTPIKLLIIHSDTGRREGEDGKVKKELVGEKEEGQ